MFKVVLTAARDNVHREFPTLAEAVAEARKDSEFGVLTPDGTLYDYRAVRALANMVL